jgi:D-proline reductase (dithiol) PrdB
LHVGLANSMTEPVHYIARTHAWYSALGYEAPYRYARFEAVPFARLEKPLSEAKLVLLTTGARYQPGLAGQSVHDPYNAQAKFYQVYTGDVREDHDIRISHVAVQREHLQDDAACWFPLEALQAAQARGRIGGLTSHFIGVPTNRSQRHTADVDAPQVLGLCQAMGADAALLVANCPVCHQTLSLVARYLEAHGIATVLMGAAKDIVEQVGVARFLFSDFPLGSAAARPFDPDSRGYMLEQALQLLEQAQVARTTHVNPLIWNGSAQWRHDYLNLAALSAQEIAQRRADNERNRAQAKGLRSNLVKAPNER